MPSSEQSAEDLYENAPCGYLSAAPGGTIVLSGEGVGLWNVVGDVALAALADDRDPEATSVEVHVDDAGFVSWARGAAAVAIQAALGRLRLPA